MKVGLFGGMLWLVALCSHADSMIEPVQAPVKGVALEEYANRWWQWAVSMPASDSPVRDRDGSKCDVGQAGDVWFLAGGYGSSKIQRHCVVPRGKHLFFPVINMLYYPGKGQAVGCLAVKKSVEINNNHLSSFQVMVDGQEFINPLQFRRGSNECFDLTARMPVASGKQSVYPAATDGYWVMLKPLAPGKHRIAFHAAYQAPDSPYGTMIQDIEYDLTVADQAQQEKGQYP